MSNAASDYWVHVVPVEPTSTIAMIVKRQQAYAVRPILREEIGTPEDLPKILVAIVKHTNEVHLNMQISVTIYIQW